MYVHAAGNFISDQAIRDAILNENNCNPALRTVAEITLQIANEQNATRVAIIRAMIEGQFLSGYIILALINYYQHCVHL